MATPTPTFLGQTPQQIHQRLSSIKWDDIQEDELRFPAADDTQPQRTDQQVLRAFCEVVPLPRAYDLSVLGTLLPPSNQRLRIEWSISGKVLLTGFYQIARWWPYVCRFHGDNTPEHGQICPLSRPKIILRRLSLPVQRYGPVNPNPNLNPRQPKSWDASLRHHILVAPLVTPPSPRLVARGKQIVPAGVEVLLAAQPTPNWQPGMEL